MNVFMWLVVCTAFLATILNIYKKPVCFKIWVATNALNAAYAFSIHSYQQGTLFLAYFMLSIWGLIKWKPKEKSQC